MLEFQQNTHTKYLKHCRLIFKEISFWYSYRYWQASVKILWGKKQGEEKNKKLNGLEL